MRLSRLIVSCTRRARGAVGLGLGLGLMMVSASGVVAAPNPWTGTAYIRQEERTSIEGQSRGPARMAMEAEVEQCNTYRKPYGLQANRPSEELLNGLDLWIAEKYFDNGRALTRRQHNTLELFDFKRWWDEFLALRGGLPKEAPDCSEVRKIDQHTTLLWMDGVRYEWGPDNKVRGSRGHPSLNPRPIGAAPEGSTPERILGQPCLRTRVRASGPVGAGESCRWTLYPAQEYLNWPWTLEARRTFGQGPKPLVETVRTLDLSVGQPSPKGLFSLPPDATVKMLP